MTAVITFQSPSTLSTVTQRRKLFSSSVRCHAIQAARAYWLRLGLMIFLSGKCLYGVVELRIERFQSSVCVFFTARKQSDDSRCQPIDNSFDRLHHTSQGRREGRAGSQFCLFDQGVEEGFMSCCELFLPRGG